MSFHFQKQLVPTTANLAPGCLFATFFKAGCKLVSLSRMTFPPGLVHVKTIAVFIMHVQYLGETLLSNIRRGKLQ